MKVFAIANEKGGVGKTTTATTLAALFNKMGHKTLLIDADKQCNSSQTAHAVTDGVATLYDVVLEDEENRVPLEEAIQSTSLGDIVPSDELMVEAPHIIAANPNTIFNLADAIQNLKGYEYVIIDCPPNLGEELNTALIASDEVIIPLRSDLYSIKGLEAILKNIDRIKQSNQNPKLKIAGLLLTHYAERTILCRDIYDSLKTYAEEIGTKVFETTIPYGIKVSEAATAGMSLLEYAPKCKQALCYKQLAKEILG